jgi:signal transduction histidine kinase
MRATHRRRNTLGLIFVAFTIYILFCALQAAFRNLHSLQIKPWAETMTLQIVWGYTWALLTPFIIWISHRFTISKQHLVRNLTLQVCFGIVFAFVHRVIYISVVPLISPTALTIPESELPRFFYFLYFISESFLDYLFIMAICQAIVFYSNYQAERLKAALLQSSLSAAQLQVLNAQINPHFLFNTLNAISALIYHNRTAAVDCIAELSDLLRASLNSSQNQTVTLKEELDFLRKYVQIQQTLLQERLSVKWNIAQETLDAEIPGMILQPLVENSIRHGISPLKRGGTLEITSFSDDRTLHLQVKDNGRGVPADSQPNNGVGLKNIQERLKYLYDTRHRFKINETAEGGVLVEMIIPFKECKAEEKDEDSHINS